MKDITTKFTRECLKCGIELRYSRKYNLVAAIKKNSPCFECASKSLHEGQTFSRKCPDCDKDIVYKLRDSMIRANKVNALCNSCKQKGDKNCHYGKHQSLETCMKQSKIRCEFLGVEITFHKKRKDKEK